MAIESLVDFVFSSQSDVWAFGVVLWEIFSLGQMPYPGMSLYQLIQRLKNGYRMDKPEYATNEIGRIMAECWNADPNQRPTFRQLEEALGRQMDPSVFTKLNQLNESCKTKEWQEKSGWQYLITNHKHSIAQQLTSIIENKTWSVRWNSLKKNPRIRTDHKNIFIKYIHVFQL